MKKSLKMFSKPGESRGILLLEKITSLISSSFLSLSPPRLRENEFPDTSQLLSMEILIKVYIGVRCSDEIILSKQFFLHDLHLFMFSRALDLEKTSSLTYCQNFHHWMDENTAEYRGKYNAQGHLALDSVYSVVIEYRIYRGTCGY